MKSVYGGGIQVVDPRGVQNNAIDVRTMLSLVLSQQFPKPIHIRKEQVGFKSGKYG